MLDVCPAICVNGRRAPTERLTARVIDPFSLANMGGEDMEVDVVDLSSKSKLLRRFVGPTGVIEGPPEWWISNSKAIPLLCEIKDEIKKGRRLLPAGAHTSRDFVFVKVRGVTLLVGNKTSSMTLALTDNAGMGAVSIEDKACILKEFLT